MTALAILAALFIILFIGAFISKRHFGLLGLALTAGATISVIWADTAGLLVSGTGLVPDGPITDAAILSLIVLLPAILLLFHGYSYKHILPRVLGSFLFASLAIAFLIEPVGHVLPLEGIGTQVYNQIITYRDAIVSIGVVLAVVDIFFTKPAHIAEKEAKKHKK